MSPKKRKLRAGPGEAKSVVAPGAELADTIAVDSAVAHSISAVPTLQRSVCQCVELMFQVRNGITVDLSPSPDASLCETFSDTVTLSGGTPSLSGVSSVLPPQDEYGFYPFPIKQGGTFIQVAQTAQGNKDWLMKESASLLHAAGLLAHDDVTELRDEYLSTDSWLDSVFATFPNRFSQKNLFQDNFAS